MTKKAAAGHDGTIKFSRDGLTITKYTNRNEIDVYSNFKNSLSKNELSNFSAKCFYIIENKNVVVLENLAHGIKSEDLIILDIKLGRSTVSYTELTNSNHKKPLLKKTKLTAVDLIRGARGIYGDDRHYTVAGYNIGGNAKGLTRDLLGMFSEYYLKHAFDNIPKKKRPLITRHILRNIYKIEETVKKINYSFVACSLLIVIDKNCETRSKARLIDFAHPIPHQDENYKKYKEQLITGLNRVFISIAKIL